MDNMYNLALQGIANKFREMGFPVRKVTEYDDSDGVATLPSLFFDPMPYCCKHAVRCIKIDKAAEIQLTCLEDDTCETCDLDDGTACLMLSPNPERQFLDDTYHTFLMNLNNIIICLSQSDVLDGCKHAWELSHSLLNKVHEENMIFLNTFDDVEAFIKNANAGKIRDMISETYVQYLLEDTIEDLRYTLMNDQMEKLLAIYNIGELLCNSVSIREEFCRTIEDRLLDLISPTEKPETDEAINPIAKRLDRFLTERKAIKKKMFAIEDTDSQTSPTDESDSHDTNSCTRIVDVFYVKRGQTHIFCNPSNVEWFSSIIIKPDDFICILYSDRQFVPGPLVFGEMMDYIKDRLIKTDGHVCFSLPSTNDGLRQDILANMMNMNIACEIDIEDSQAADIRFYDKHGNVSWDNMKDRRVIGFSFFAPAHRIQVSWDTKDNMDTDLNTAAELINFVHSRSIDERLKQQKGENL